MPHQSLLIRTVLSGGVPRKSLLNTLHTQSIMGQAGQKDIRTVQSSSAFHVLRQALICSCTNVNCDPQSALDAHCPQTCKVNHHGCFLHPILIRASSNMASGAAFGLKVFF
eukprot:1155996-Pelagomonas_calceolata.AAC.5